MYYNVTLRRVHVTTVAVQKARSLTYLYVRVRARACARARRRVHARACMHVVLLIQHATRMLQTVTSFVASLTAPYFSTLSHIRHDFRKTLLNIKRVLNSSTTFV